MRALIMVAAALVLTGCAGGPMQTPSSPPSSANPGTPSASGAPSTPGPAPSPSADPTSRFETTAPLPDSTGPAVTLPAALLDAVRSDLDQRGVEVGDLRVISSHRATWQDGAWGCPAPGRLYTQAVEEGYVVIVEADGAQYDYRFGSGPVPKLCSPPGQR